MSAGVNNLPGPSGDCLDLPDCPAGLLPRCRRVAVAMGVFDGVHIGHRSILRNLAEAAAQSSAEPVALFFAPHPRAVLAPPAPPLLTGLPEKCALLRASGARHLVCIPFTRELAALAPEAFLERYFAVPGLTVTAFCVGERWRFGHGNGGGTEQLGAWAARRGIAVRVVPAVCHGGSPVSSTRIRGEVSAGRLNEATAMLGRPFSISGIVCHGNRLGSAKLHYPTANICDPEHLLPPFGVYAASAYWDGRTAHGIAYVGEAPTMRDTDNPLVLTELNLFDIDENLYGRRLTVAFRLFIRPSIRFPSPLALKQQIDADVKRAHSFFASNP